MTEKSARPPTRRLSRPAQHWLGQFLDAQLAGAPMEATVWRAQHAKSISAQEELQRRRMIEAEDHSHYVVTLLGLITASGAPARLALSHCERLFRVLRRHYSQDPKHPMLVANTARQTRLSESQVLQAAKFLQRSPTYLSIHPHPENPALFPNERYVTLKNFAQLQEQALAQTDLATPTPLPWISPTLDTSALPETLPATVPRVTQGHCPCCGPERAAAISGQHVERWEERSVSGSETYNILKCSGCGQVYCQRLTDCSEDADLDYDDQGAVIHTPRPNITYWPAPVIKVQPSWVAALADDTLREVLQEVYGALNADYRILAAIGARTALDRAMVLLQAPEADGFVQKLNDLVQRHVISPREKDILVVLTDAGSASAHRGWRPAPQNLTTMMDGMENFLHRLFVLGDAANAMKAHVPPRPRRIKVPKPTP